MATRAEMRQPGTLERTFAGRGQAGPGFGAMVGSSLLGTIAGVVIGSAVANALFGPAFADRASPWPRTRQRAPARTRRRRGRRGRRCRRGVGRGPAGGADGGGFDGGGFDGGGFDDFGGFGEF